MESKILSSAMADEEIGKLNARSEEIAKALEEMRASIDGEADLEKREQLIKDAEALKSEKDAIPTKIVELEETRETMKGQEKRMSLLENVSTEVVESRKVNLVDETEYRDAWVEYVKTANRNAFNACKSEEARALATSTENIPVPTEMQRAVETAWANYGKLSKLVTKTYIKANLEIPYELTADGANWHDEGAVAPAEEAITFGMLEIKPRMIKKWISLTDELMALAGSEFIDYIAEELVYRVVLLLDNAIINGTLSSGDHGVLGIANDTNVPSISSAPHFNVVNKALAELKFIENVSVVVNPKTFFDTMMGMADSTGRPIYTIGADNAGKPRYYLNGNPVEFTDALPAVSTASTGAVWMVVGNLKAYRLNMPNGDGVDTLVDPYTLATEDKVRFIGKLFAGGRVSKFGRLVSVKKSA